MIGAVLTAMMWGEVVTGNDSSQLVIDIHPQTKHEILRNKKKMLRQRFKKDATKELNREFFAGLAKSEKSLSPEEIVAQANGEEVVQDKSPRNILVVAPHPDDEILCCANTIADHIARGDKVSIVVITDGDGKEQGDARHSLNYGELRRSETVAAARKLGIPQSDVMFLGFPDGHLSDLEKKGRTRSKFTSLVQTLRTSLFPGTPYSWSGLQGALRKVLTKKSPDMVYLPGDHDTHLDHQAAGHAVRNAARVLRLNPEWNEYSVHFATECAADQPVNQKKLSLIRLFRSQRHTREHTKYLEEFASRAEEFIKK